jgi:hypothetical protein
VGGGYNRDCVGQVRCSLGNEDQEHSIRSMTGHSAPPTSKRIQLPFSSKVEFVGARIFTLRNMKHMVHLNPWDRVTS